MKVLHVIPSFAPAWEYGGPIYAVLAMTRELVREDCEITVMTTNINKAGVLDVPLECPVSVEEVETWYFPVEYPRWYCFSRSLARGLKKHVRRFDLVHIHSVFLWPTTIASFWCRKYKVPYIIRPAGALSSVCILKPYDKLWASWSSKIKKGFYLKTVGKKDLENAAAIHFTSIVEREEVHPLGLKPPHFIIPMGIDLPHPTNKLSGPSFRDRDPRLKEKKLILFLSRIDPKKGVGFLLAALSDLAKKRDDFVLGIAGSGTKAYELEVQTLVEHHGLSARTIFYGFVEGEDKWSLLHQSDIFVLPSYQENFGFAVVEAMAAGVPVVISQQVGICTEVSKAASGFTVSLNNSEIASAIERLLESEMLRKEMGRNGASLVREKFTWKEVIKHLLREYERIIRTEVLDSM